MEHNSPMTGERPLPRQQRRALQRKGLTPEQAKNLREKTVTVHDYLHYYDLAICDALYCELDLPNTEIKKVFDKIKETVNCLGSGHLSCFDLEQMVEDEIGIRFKRR